MRRALIALALAVALIVVSSAPASATNRFQFRLVPGSGTWQQDPPFFFDLPVHFSTAIFGFTGFLMLPGQRWGLRLNIDTGGLSNLQGDFLIYDSGHWRNYELAVGVPFTLGSAHVTPFLGFGSQKADFSELGTVITRQEANGFVFGADVWVPISGRWYFAGSATLGPSHAFKYTNSPPADPRAEGLSNFALYSAGIGYKLPGDMAKVELGWRSGGFTNTQITSGDAGVLNSAVRWQGVYLGVTIHR